ncbi:MAG: DUF86 domain-containing protein [Elusimicrobia bacterium]|nr:DUF86 domain-containing protein [Elusimicrobiota bacterium]
MIKRDYRDYIKDILDSINDVREFIKNMKYNEFICDRKTVNAVVRSVEIIGEASKKIPKSVKDKYPNVPWKKMAGMRDKLIHEYFGIDTTILWEVATKEIFTIESPMKNIFEDLNNSNK